MNLLDHSDPWLWVFYLLLFLVVCAVGFGVMFVALLGFAA